MSTTDSPRISERSESHALSINVVLTDVADKTELQTEKSSSVGGIDAYRSESQASRTPVNREQMIKSPKLSSSLLRSFASEFRIDNTSFYREQIAHLTHEIQDMTRQLKDERARSAQHMRTVSELEFTLNQERESNAQERGKLCHEINVLQSSSEQCTRALEYERNQIVHNVKTLAKLESACAQERRLREDAFATYTTERQNIQDELNRTLKLLEDERLHSNQLRQNIEEIEQARALEREGYDKGNKNVSDEVISLQEDNQRLNKLLNQERSYASDLSKTIGELEQQLKIRQEEFDLAHQKMQTQMDEVRELLVQEQNLQTELKLTITKERTRVSTLECELQCSTKEVQSQHAQIEQHRSQSVQFQRKALEFQTLHKQVLRDNNVLIKKNSDLLAQQEQLTAIVQKMEKDICSEKGRLQANIEAHAMRIASIEEGKRALQVLFDVERQKQAESELKRNEIEIALIAAQHNPSTSNTPQDQTIVKLQTNAQESLRALSEERSHVSALERKISELERDKIRLNAEAEEATNRLKRKTTECEEIEVRVRERDAALVGERDRVQELTRQIRSLEDAATAMRSDVERTQSELRQSREANSSVATEVTRLQSTLETERKRIVTLNTRITELESELRTESERRQLLDRSNKDVDGVRTKLENDLHDVQRVLAEERRKISDLQRSNSELMSAARNHQSELDRVKDHERVRISELEHKLTLAREECTTVHREREALRKELHQCNRMKFVESDGKSAKEIQLATALNIAETDLEWTKKALERERKRNAELANVLESVQKDRHQLVLQRSVSQASFRGSMSPRLSAQSIIENEIQQVGLMKEFGSVVASPTGSQKSTRTNHLEAIKIQESRKNVPIVSSANVVGDSDIVSNSKELSSFPVVDADVDGTFVDVDEAS